MRRATAAALVLTAIGVSLGISVRRRGRDEGARCGTGFVPHAARCLPSPGTCPSPLARTAGVCDAPDVRVRIPATSVIVGPTDWEATGQGTPRTVDVGAFRVDAFEVTRGRWGATDPDAARAASGMTYDEAAAFCAARGGRLPTEDEWIAAATSSASPARRYPWGDTGAVCRRAAWGLAEGPCANGGDGPDTVGAHPDGDSPLGVHDLAGNVAEWVTGTATGARTGGTRVAMGGSWRSSLASALRVWSRVDLGEGARDPSVGLRCAYPP